VVDKRPWHVYRAILLHSVTAVILIHLGLMVIEDVFRIVETVINQGISLLDIVYITIGVWCTPVHKLEQVHHF